MDKEEGEKMTTLRTTVVFLLGFYTFCQETRASVQGASVPGASVPGASVLGRPLLYGPSTALEKTVEEFQCEVLRYPKEESILYQLFREGDRSKALGFYSALSGEMANFPLYITASYEGYMVCVASVQNNTVIQPTVSQRHHLRVVDPVNGAEVVVQSGSVEFYEGKPLSLRCNIAKGTHVSYQWLVDGKPLPLSPSHNQTQEQLFIYRMVPQDSGEYTCVATNQLNITKVYSSRSTAKVIKVKELVSEPDLLFLVLKERDGTYFALVTCQSLKGTPPITFSLYSRSEFISTETVDERFATFSIPVVLDLHMGFLQCQAQNGDRVVYGQWTAMHVVAVGGAVTMHYNTDVGENFSIVGLRFYCSVERGTFPQYRWFLNGTVLEGRGEFYWVENQPEQSILLLSVGRSSAGTYHCEVSDSFDGTTVIRSEARYIDKEVLNHLPTTVVAVVFGCFLFLVTLVTTCCFIGLLYQKRQCLVEKSTLDLKLGLEMHNIMVSDDDEEFLGRQCIMDEEEYMEDDGVVRAARIVDSDQIFSIVVFSCITAEGFVNKSHSPDAHCVFNQNDSACHYAVGIGVIAFLACFFFLLLDAYMPLMSNAKERKYAVMADLGFSVVWTFLWFVCFCLLTSQWSRTIDVRGIPQDAARSAIAFSFFSIATWGILTYFALGRYRRGVTDVTQSIYAESPPEQHTPYPPTYAPSAYTPTTYSPYPSSAPDDFQQPPFTPSTTTTTQPQGEYQPPNY